LLGAVALGGVEQLLRSKVAIAARKQKKPQPKKFGVCVSRPRWMLV